MRSGPKPARVAILGSGIAGAAIAYELSHSNKISIVIIPGHLKGSTTYNQRWLHSGLLYQHRQIAEKIWTARSSWIAQWKPAVTGPPYARFIVRDGSFKRALSARWSDWNIEAWGLGVEELDDGFLTPDLAFDFPSAAANMMNRASSAGATILYSRCARRIDIDRPDRVRIILDDGQNIEVDHCIVAMGAWSVALLRAAGVEPPVVIRRCAAVRFSKELVPSLTVWLDARGNSSESRDLSLAPFKGTTIAAESDGDEVMTPYSTELLERRVDALIAEYAELHPPVRSATTVSNRYCFKLEHRTGISRVEMGVMSQNTISDWPSRLTLAFPGKATMACALAKAVLVDLSSIPIFAALEARSGSGNGKS